MFYNCWLRCRGELCGGQIQRASTTRHHLWQGPKISQGTMCGLEVKKKGSGLIGLLRMIMAMTRTDHERELLLFVGQEIDTNYPFCCRFDSR
jgi:hypothetical protein